MKITTSILVMTLLSAINTVNAQSKRITATVVNANSDAGKVGFALYNKTTFMKTPIQNATAKIENGKSTVIFEDVVSGEYSIVCYHDKNDNNQMDFQENGMPLEDYGASNNVMNFGPPQYKDSKFIVSDKNVSLNIKF